MGAGDSALSSATARGAERSCSAAFGIQLVYLGFQPGACPCLPALGLPCLPAPPPQPAHRLCHMDETAS